MMLTPCLPSAGPIGGAGFALPALMANLMTATTFFAIYLLALFLNLIKLQFYGSVPPKDGEQRFELAALWTDFNHFPFKILERTREHQNFVSGGHINFDNWLLLLSTLEDTLYF